MQCQKHENDYMLVCVQCNYELVCSQCLIDYHNGHRMTSFGDSEKIIKTKLQDMATTNTHALYGRRQVLDIIRKAKEQNEEASKKITQQVEQERDKLHAIIDGVANKLLSDCEVEKMKNWTFLNDQDVLVSKQISNMSKIDLEIKEIMEEKSQIKMIQAYKNLSPLSLEEIQYQAANQLHFTEGDGRKDHAHIREYFGVVSNNPIDADKGSDFLDLEEETQNMNLSQVSDFAETFSPTKKRSLDSSFQHSRSTAISIIRKVNHNECWVKLIREAELKRVDELGNIKDSIKPDVSRVRGFCVSGDGIVYLTCQKPNCVKAVDRPKDAITTLFNTGAVIPIEVVCTPSGELLVALVDDLNYDSSHQKTRYLIKCDKNGKELIRADKDQFNDNIFNIPFIIGVNNSGSTVAVVNEVSKETAYLILLDEKLEIKRRYLGNARVFHGDQKFIVSSFEKFFVWDVQFDGDDNILFCEKFSKSILMLNPACNVLTTLFTDDVFPRTFTFDREDKLWVGRDDGRIKILK